MKKTFMAFFIVSIFITSLSFQRASAQSWSISGNSASSSSKLGTTSNAPLKFYTNDIQRMVIDSLGKVGIGTPTPLNILTVKLNGSTPSSAWLAGGSSLPAFLAFGENQATGFNLATAANPAGYRPVLNTRRSRGTLAAPTSVANDDYLASFVSSGYDGSTFQNPAAIDFYVDGSPSAGNVPARISFVTGTNAGNRLERLLIGSTGDVSVTAGNLIMGSSEKTIQFATPTGNSTAMMTMFPSGTSNSDRMVISHSPSYPSWGLQYQDAVDKFNFLSNGAPVLTADLGSKKVGIGTSSPQLGKLVVEGAAGNTVAVFRGSPTAKGLSLVTDWPGIYFNSYWNAGQKALSPGYAGILNFDPTSGNIYLGNSAAPAANAGDGIGTSAALLLNKFGNVGVGTTTPAYRLDVAGRMRIQSGGGTAGTWFMNGANTIDAAFVGMVNDSYVGLYGTGAGWGFVMNRLNGNVGIGTFSPGYKLDVCGTIRAKEIRVESGWCDYVFEKDYKLKSIDELEKFINDNKHLPGIVPAAQVEKEGLKVAEMNKAMMEKIEELTLYVIQLGKENKKLQNEIDSLKK